MAFVLKFPQFFFRKIFVPEFDFKIGRWVFCKSLPIIFWNDSFLQHLEIKFYFRIGCADGKLCVIGFQFFCEVYGFEHFFFGFVRNADHHISEEPNSRIACHFAGAFHFFGCLAFLQVLQVFRACRFYSKMDTITARPFQRCNNFFIDGVNTSRNFEVNFNAAFDNEITNGEYILFIDSDCIVYKE